MHGRRHCSLVVLIRVWKHLTYFSQFTTILWMQQCLVMTSIQEGNNCFGSCLIIIVVRCTVQVLQVLYQDVMKLLGYFSYK